MNVTKLKVLLAFLLITLFVNAQEVKRVVSLTPSVTENLYLIGAGDKLVGCTSYCTVAVEKGVQKVGSAVDVNVEKIFMLQPDLVLTMKLTKEQDVAALRKLGIKVEVMETPKNFEEICGQCMHIAKLIGHESDADSVLEKTNATVEQIREHASQKPGRKIFFQIGTNPVFTVLENTFMDDYITICNGENIAAGLSKGTITRESVLVKNPDVIIIAAMGGFGEEEIKIWKSYESIPAVKNDKVFVISSETSCSPTPDNFVSALKDVYRFIYED